MAQTQTLSFIDEIQSLVSDQLQVVSYKWLSRNYMVSSDEAKRLLQEFVQKHEVGLEVVYALSGWLKSNHPSYHVRLVTGPKLAESQQEFEGDCSVQVYSVQASIPKDPAVLWNAEFIQAEELFKQPSSVANCLRDNRFSGISNSFVRRDGPLVSATPPTKSVVGEGPTRSHIVNQPPKSVSRDSIAKVDSNPQNVVKDVKSESNGTWNIGVRDNINKPNADKEKVPPLPTGKKKVQADKSGPVTGGSLANFWGRASAKTKPCSLQAENITTVSNPAVSTVDAQTSARQTEDCDSGDDDNQDVSLRKSSSNRKRRVVFDFSDEDEDYEDAISLASPDFPDKQSSHDSRQNDKKTSEKATLNFDQHVENKSDLEEETNQKAGVPLRDVSVINKCTSTGKSTTQKLQSCAPEVHVDNDTVKKAASCSPKRRKVMKTRIDERGREVTEVVWEGEETEVKKPDKGTTMKADSNASSNAINSAPAIKKPQAISNTTSNATGKGGNKKAGNKDPKQGNILSFFKRV